MKLKVVLLATVLISMIFSSSIILGQSELEGKPSSKKAKLQISAIAPYAFENTLANNEEFTIDIQFKVKGYKPLMGGSFGLQTGNTPI